MFASYRNNYDGEAERVREEKGEKEGVCVPKETALQALNLQCNCTRNL